MSDGKIIAVWGTPGSGKSVVAAKLAARFAECGRATILLFCDTLAPMLPCVCAEFERERSLGSVFAAAHCSANLMRNNLTVTTNGNLSLLGFQKGESSSSYPQYSERLAVEIVSCLREIAEFTIVDCSSELDTLTLASLRSADATLRLVSGELKSQSYYASQLPTLRQNVTAFDSHLRVANAPRPQSAWERLGRTLSKTDFSLPYSAELERQCSDGNLLAELKTRDGKAFEREINKIISKLEVL